MPYSTHGFVINPAWIAIVVSLLVFLIFTPQAIAQSASGARARVAMANEMLDKERFDDVEPSLQQAEKQLEGLPAAEKDPILKSIAEVRAKIEPARKAAAARTLVRRLMGELHTADDDIGPRSYDVEKKLTKMSARLETDEVTKVLEVPDIAKLKARIEEIRKKLAASEAGGGEKPKVQVTGNVNSAKSRVGSARSFVESRRFENVEPTLEEAEAYLNGLSEAEKAPILKDIAEIRALLAEGTKAEQARIYSSQLDRYLRGAIGTHPDATRDMLKKINELLDSKEVQGVLGSAKIAEFRGRLAEVEKQLAAEKKAFALDRAQGLAQELEEMLSGDPLEGKDEFEAYKVWRDLDYRLRAARKWLADIPKGDAEAGAVETKLAALKVKIDGVSSKWSSAQVEAAVKGGWEFAAQSFEGWQEEKPDAAKKPNEMWMMVKTVTAARTSAYWLADEQMKKMCEANAGNAVVKATVAEAQKTRDSALAKLNEAFNAAMGAAEKLPTPIRENRWDRVIASWMAGDAKEVFAGSKFEEPNVKRAKALDARWEKEIDAIMKAAAEKRAQLSKEADKAWPAIVEAVGPDETFNVRQLARSKGDRILIKKVYNRTGWDFDGTYDFTVRIDGVAIGGDFSKEIGEALAKMWEKMDAPPLSDREEWDVIALVEGPAKIKRRVTTKLIDAVTREEIGKIEGHETEDGVGVKIIGLHAGPMAVGSKR